MTDYDKPCPRCGHMSFEFARKCETCGYDKLSPMLDDLKAAERRRLPNWAVFGIAAIVVALALKQCF